MTWTAFLLVFVSVFLHVSWNMLSKSVRPSVAFFAIMSLTGSAVWLGFFAFSNLRLAELSSGFWWLLAASVFGELLYMLGLARAYKRGDISLVYPVVRALPVLMVAAITMLTGFGTSLSATAVAGMVLISAGCLVMPLARFGDFRFSNYWNRTIAFVVLGAIGTTIYTIVDKGATGIMRDEVAGFGVGCTLSYLFMIELGLCVGEFAFVAFSRQERRAFRVIMRRPLYPLLAGVCSSSAYGLVLLAMNFVTNVSYIQAFRQLSLPLGFVAGVMILKERSGAPKLAGVAMIVAGLLLVALG
ncbi:MAG: hypothetical protein AB7F40_08215 [Victivallaceae bacterium]|nr:hypothetical protein [Victivallaceae bacterium]